jgi:predicted AAA+ superfamily ATPase
VIHPEEAVSEKHVALRRFGCSSASSGSTRTLPRIVEEYARRLGLPVEPETLRADALRWALSRDRAGRTAKQFIDDLPADPGAGGRDLL